MGGDRADAIREPGHFGFQPVAGLVRPDGVSQWGPIAGLPMTMQYAYGTFRGVYDDHYFWPIRGTFIDRARRMHLSIAAPGEDFTWAPEGHAAFTGQVAHEGRHGWTGAWAGDELLYGTTGDRFRWNEGDLLNVEGELVGHALQFQMPDAREPMIYTSRLFRGTGKVLGCDVRGLFFHDSMHMPHDQDFIRSAYINDLQAAWVAFATEFEDGTIHAGHLVWGTQGFDVMVIERSDGAAIVVRDLDVEVVIEDDYPTEVVYRGAGETWIWTAHGPCYRDPIRDDLPEGHRRVQGWVRREGETRRPVLTEGLMETYNGRLTDALR